MAYSIATETYRRIEQFLVDHCHKKIRPVGHEELRTLFSVILNFKDYLTEKEAQALVAFLQMTYHLQPVTISQQTTLTLYRALQQILKQKLTTKFACPLYNQKQQKLRPQFFKHTENNPVFDLQRLWNDRYEQQLIEGYRTHQQFVTIRETFKANHPQHQHVWTVKALKSQFYKIIRAALRQMANFIAKHASSSLP